jgi:hypothetical protein
VFGDDATVSKGSGGASAINKASHRYRSIRVREEKGGLGEERFAINHPKYK